MDAWVNDRRPTALLRGSLEVKSDFGFIDMMAAEMQECLAREGLDPGLALAALAEVLSAPGLALSSDTKTASDIAHAVMIRRDDDGGFPYDVLVSLRATVTKRYQPAGQKSVPPAVDGFTIECALYDFDDDSQLGELMNHYVSLVRQMGPKRSQRTFAHTVLVLGDLLALGTAGTPPHWREDLAALAEAYDARVVFEQGPNLPAGAPRDLIRLFRFDPYAGELPKGTDDKEIAHVPVEARFASYADVFHAMTASLNSFVPAAVFNPLAPRKLAPGEEVYHRKVGDSGGGHDNFDEGSSTPCSHGKGWKRYHHSDKAVKGFKRRYTNFTSDWIYHCKHGSCGVYAVFCPANAS